MALLFFTGFENDTQEGAYSNLQQYTGQKRTGSYSGNQNNNNVYLRVDYSGSEKTFIFGVAFYLTIVGYNTGFMIYNEAGVQCSVVAVGNSYTYVKRGAWNGTILSTGTQLLTLNTWYHIEAKITINNTTGAAITKINGVEDINISGVDTQFQSTDSITSLYLGVLGNSRSYNDDFYICDTAGSVNNDFLGAVRVEGLQPDGNGYISDFVGSDVDSTDNYLHVDEVPDDGDTSYVGSATISDIDSFTLDNLTGSISSVKGVKVNSIAKVSDTFSRNYKNFIRVGGTNYLGVEKDPDTNYNNDFDIWEEDPNTATGWTETGVNGIEIGVTVTS